MPKEIRSRTSTVNSKKSKTTSPSSKAKGSKLTKILTGTLLLLMLVAFAGCGSYFDSGTPEPTSTTHPTQATTETSTPASINVTSSPTITQSTTATSKPNFTKEEKYGYFRDGYVEGMEDGGVNVLNDTLNPENETIYITYEMRDPNSDLYTGRERENVSLGYVAAVDFYLNGNISELDKTWVPKRVNVTAVTPEGELYETAYTTFERAKKMIDGEISAKRYLLEYYNTIEPGPANPDYEGGS